MQSIDLFPRRGSIIKCSVLDDIRDEGLRMKTLRVLRTVPTTDVKAAFYALASSYGNVEEACWLIFEKQYKEGKIHLPLNEFVRMHTRVRVERLQAMHPESSTQECNVAVKIARGRLDDAAKHLAYMHEQKDENGGEMGFLIDSDWIPDIVL